MAREGKRGFGDGWRRGDSETPTAIDSAGPIDVVAVRRDDALLDAIAGDGPVATDNADEYQLAALLADWRAELVAPPLPAGPDLDTVVAAVNREIGAQQARTAEYRSSRGHLRLVRPLMGAAAAIAVIAGGMMAFSYGAQPGDPLWGVKQVVFSEQANSTIAQKDATADLDEARTLIQQGKPVQAKANLEHAAARAAAVGNTDSRNQLLDQVNQLLTTVQQAAPGLLPTTPGLQATPGYPPKPSLPNHPTKPTTPPISQSPVIPGLPTIPPELLPKFPPLPPLLPPASGSLSTTMPPAPPANGGRGGGHSLPTISVSGAKDKPAPPALPAPDLKLPTLPSFNLPQLPH